MLVAGMWILLGTSKNPFRSWFDKLSATAPALPYLMHPCSRPRTELIDLYSAVRTEFIEVQGFSRLPLIMPLP